jgi:ABC-type sugar transport system substrate-binding protein
VLLAGCSGSDDDGDGGDSSTEDGGDSSNGGNTTTDTDTGSTSYDIGIVHSTLNLGGATLAQARGAQWYGDSRDDLNVELLDGGLDPTKQNEQLQSLIQQGVDAIGVVPLDANVVSARAEEANDQGIPMFTVDTFANTELVPVGASKANRLQGQQIAEHLVTILEERRGAPEARYAHVSAPTRRPAVQARVDGIRAGFSQYDNIEEVDMVVADPASVQNATEKVGQYLQTSPDVNAMITNWIGGNYGILNGLERFDMKYAQSEDEHIPFVGIGCDSRVIEAIDQGFHDGAISPGEQYQYPIAIELMTRYLDAGEDPSVLPEIGTTLESGEFNFPDSVDGVNVFGEPIWAPAEVTEAPGGGYPYVPVGAALVTQENSQEDFLYGNFLPKLE